MNIDLTIPRAWKITRILLVIIGVLIALSVLGQVSKYFFDHPQLKGFVPLFYVDYESNVPTWYSSIGLLLAAILLAGIAAAKWQVRDSYRYVWALLSALFVMLSIDEVSGIHELPIEPFRDTLGAGGLLYYTWVIPGAIFVGITGLTFLKFLCHLPVRTRNLMLLAGVVFVGGAIGVEMFSGLQADNFSEETFVYAMIVTVEEFCEMLGVVIFLHALLDYLNRNYGNASLTIHSDAATLHQRPSSLIPVGQHSTLNVG